MLNRILPHPYLTLLLTIFWLQLVNKVTLGNVLLGFALAVIIPAMTEPYWPDRPRVRRPFRAISYVGLVLWDIVLANIEVAKIVLFKPAADIRSQWVSVPLDLKSPEAIAVLAGTITLTPGTVSAMLAADGGAILVHCLHTDNPDAVRDEIKTRYEARLKEIFE
ncbi:multisubunit potassium/proton antiporter, PhaE subunit [Poseidonocella pacifica]|uniref:Multisubunit potassium/proton antiporter, PhaE subunit n=1 Tax=Poseidonocella pacifica TaxID=871651 RepID=A0A1I0XA24_9RHOB|nr:Na+/H+ antiporter subunit E [Poseidonocella pacifica]SFA96793.1 multisubunit potassium/proton antiporter, PhaE subunit [Poseidonocella pacifica]